MVMVQDHQISKAKACKIVGFSRSAFYKSTVDWAAKDAPVIDALNERLLPSAPGGAFGSAITGFAVTAMYGTTNECIGCIAR